MFKLFDKTGDVYASSPHLSALMRLMETRWAGKVVADDGDVLFDIETDRKAGLKVTPRVARAELNLAWSRLNGKPGSSY